MSRAANGPTGNGNGHGPEGGEGGNGSDGEIEPPSPTVH